MGAFGIPVAFNTVIERPPINSIGEYDFPSRSAQANYGDDQLVMVWYDGNPWFVAPGCFRAPKAMTFADFWAQMVVPYSEEDPDWQATWTPQDFEWGLDDAEWAPQADTSLADLGVGHKSVIRMLKK
jgi:phenol hydroxylase P4 protein